MARRPASPAVLAHLARLNSDPEIASKREARLQSLRADPAFTSRRALAVSRARADRRVYHLVHGQTGQRASGTRAQLRAQFGISTAKITSLLAGRYKNSLGWRFAPKSQREVEPPALLGPRVPTLPNKKLRMCLFCRREFLSSHAGHRRCRTCEQSTASYQPHY